MTTVPFPGSRRTRRPKHRFFVQPHIWEIQPIALAPVLPGETLSHLTIQSRVVTPNVKSAVVGWWLEYYVFYVPFRQMPSATTILSMFVDPSSSLSASTASALDYIGTGCGYDWQAQCIQPIVQEWFRREGESWSGFPIRTGRPAVSLGIDDFANSMIDTTVLPDGGALAGNLDDMERARIVLEYRRQLAISGGDGANVDYEEILSTYGVRLGTSKERDRPELIRYLRQWSYPVNTVEPTTGVPVTAVSWAVADRADKRRYFKEPGFIAAYQVLRPKIYYGWQTSNASAMLDRAQAFLPPLERETGTGLEQGLREFAVTAGPFGTPAASHLTNGYWVDLRDLFNNGDQWIDTTLTSNANPAGNIIALPSAAQNRRYGTQTIANTLLVTADALSLCDGALQFEISSGVVDASA